MEQKKNKTFMPFLLNSLKSKGSWMLLSTVIIFVTTLLVPYILKADNAEGTDANFFMGIGIFEVFVMVFVNCLIDNSFFHSDSKLAYYKSKPVSLKEQVVVNIITEIIFAGLLLGLIVLLTSFQIKDYEILKVFNFVIPWILVLIFLSALSSILAGNTLAAGVMTVFNFALPGIVYLIIVFIFSIVEDFVAGFSIDVLTNYFLDNVYKLEYIYFTKYLNEPVDYIYFLILGIILMAITLLIFKTLKKRKNENTGNFIVFDGYKYFVSVLGSLIIPAFFTVSNYSNNITSEIIVALMMAALTYYVIIAVIEKSFRISKFSIKVFTISMVLFMAATGGTVAFANQYKDVVPDVEDVKYAFVDSNTRNLNFANKYIEENHNLNLSYDDIIKLKDVYGVILFTEKENIRNIIDLHKEMLKNGGYNNEDYRAGNLVITYFMNDGSYIIREYDTDCDNSAENGKKDELALKILNSNELKRIKYNYLYDEEYCKNNYNIELSVGYDFNNEYIASDITIEELRPYLIKDINKEFTNTDKAFLALGGNFDQSYKGFNEPSYYLDIVIKDKEDPKVYYRVQTLYFNEGYENTKEYLKSSLPELK